MPSSTDGPEIVRVSQKGQATIPKPLREKFGIETPGEVFVYEEDGRIVLEPVPSLEDLHGIHAGDREPGSVLATVREIAEEERSREAEEARTSSTDTGATRRERWSSTSSTPSP